MENAADALKMAGAVLIFVIALSISIVSFGQVRQASDVILNYRDRETVYIDGDYYYEATGTERTVGLETVIPSIYRAYNEQYKIVFQFADGRPIYKCTYSSGNSVERSVLDSAFEYNRAVITTEDRNQNNKTFLHYIIYGIQDTNFNNWYGINGNRKIELPYGNLYDRLKNKTITEYLGVYYPVETSETETTTDEDFSSTEQPDANKVEKRIITYVIN